MCPAHAAWCPRPCATSPSRDDRGASNLPAHLSHSTSLSIRLCSSSLSPSSRTDSDQVVRCRIYPFPRTHARSYPSRVACAPAQYAADLALVSTRIDCLPRAARIAQLFEPVCCASAYSRRSRSPYVRAYPSTCGTAHLSRAPAPFVGCVSSRAASSSSMCEHHMSGLLTPNALVHRAHTAPLLGRPCVHLHAHAPLGSRARQHVPRTPAAQRRAAHPAPACPRRRLHAFMCDARIVWLPSSAS
jgi:hypothetical protein